MAIKTHQPKESPFMADSPYKVWEGLKKPSE
jgi:hypothetical protein